MQYENYWGRLEGLSSHWMSVTESTKDKSIKVLVGEARQAVEERNWSLAASLWDECIQRFGTGEQPWWHSNYARALIEIKEFDEAGKVLQKLVIDHPDFSPGYANQATLACRQGAWQLAADQWRACISQFDDEDQPGWNSSYASALIELEKFDEAESILEKLRIEHPNFSPGYAGLASIANIAMSQQSWNKAADNWKICIQHVDIGTQPGWYVSYARAQIELQQYDAAESILDKVLRNTSDFSFAHLCMATLSSRQQKWEQAVERWSNCLKRFKDSENHGWYKNLSYALVQLERFEEAKQVSEKFGTGFSDDFAILAGLAKVAYQANDLENCLHYAEVLREKFPEKYPGYRWGEQALIKQGRFSAAADVHLTWSGFDSTPGSSTSLPDNYPDSLVLPPIPGNGNDYTFIEEQLADFEDGERTYSLPVSIVIPVYNRAAILSRTLASLTHQTYPRDLIEVIVADDGSTDNPERVVEKYSTLLDIRHVRQEDKGFRAAAVRNLGIRAARSGHLIFLDCDMMPLPDLVEAYMKYFHVTDKAVLFGLRRYVCANAYTDDEIVADVNIIRNLPDIEPAVKGSTWQSEDGRYFDYRVPVLVRTNKLKEELFPCRVFLSGNMALPRIASESAGYFDEDFQAWGGEDNEFGYRLCNEGYYVIPVSGALALHQEPSDVKSDFQVDRSEGRKETQPMLEQKYPIPEVRKYKAGMIYEVPKVSIYIPAYNVEEYIQEAVDSVLSQTYTDVEVVICNDGSTDGTLSVIEKSFANDPRVRWISQSNQGIAAATNAAISACKGMYIGQLDGDDVLHPQAVEAFVSHLDSKNDGAVYGFHALTDRNGKVMRVIHSVPFSREELLVKMICTSFRMFRKRDWSRIAGCDLSLENAVDYDLMQKLSEVCSISYIPQLTYYYRIHGENTSFSKRNLQEINHIQVINKALKRMRLSSKWLAVAGPSDDRRRVNFINKEQ